MNVIGRVVAEVEGVGGRVSTESMGRSKAVGGHGALEVGRREEVEAKRWWIRLKGGSEEQGNVSGIWERMMGRAEGWAGGSRKMLNKG